MKSIKNKIIFAIIILILAAGSGYYIRQNIEHRVLDITETSEVEEESAAADDGKISDVEKITMPDLDRPIKVIADLPEDAEKIARDKIEGIIKKLKENPDLFSSWLELGVYRKMLNDYEGAAEVWEYAGKIRPNNSISFNNLGDIYGYYLKDGKKAEENFLRALENSPDKIYIYRNTYEFYRNVLEDDGRAKAILQKGIELNPEASEDLQNLLNNF